MNKIDSQLWQIKSRHTGEIMPCIYTSIEDAFKYKSTNDYELIPAVRNSIIIQDYEELIENRNMDSLDWMQLLFDMEQFIGDNSNHEDADLDRLIKKIHILYPEQIESFKNEANDALKNKIIRIISK